MARINPAFLRALDSNGSSSSGALLKFTENLTTTPVDTYSDAALSVKNAWPVVADAEGKFPEIYTHPGLYRVRMETSDGTLIQQLDYVPVEQDGYATRAAFVTAAATMTGGTAPADGTIVFAGGVAYERQAGASMLPNLPGWVPYGDPQLEHFGAEPGGTDYATAITAANANSPGNVIKTKAGTYVSSGAFSTITKRITGDGTLQVSSYKRGRDFSYIDGLKTFPTATGWLDQFNGDNSASPYQIDVQYENGGTNPFGPVGSTYKYAPHITPVFAQLRVGADVGYNSTLNTNGPGRTGATVFTSKVSHMGQGDAACYNAAAFVGSNLPGATTWLAGPAAVLYNGHITAGANNVYLNTTEFRTTGGPYDCAAIGAVYNMTRDVDTGALGQGWEGIRIQSQGTKELNSGFRIDGAVDVAFNVTRMHSTRKAAFAMAQDDRIYYNAAGTGDFGTTLGSTYTTYDGTGITTVVGGTVQLKVTSSEVQVEDRVRVGPTALILAGTGTPEGAVPGPVGSIYMRTDGGSGTTLYVKEGGGATNTGWAAV